MTPTDDLLRRTSRSFYLSLRVLPAASRGVVGLTYLLARLADTIADTPLLAADRREPLLIALRSATVDPGGRAALARELAAAAAGTEGAEARLLERTSEALARADELPPSVRPLVRDVLSEIVSGMILDQRWFPDPTVRALPDLLSLRRYCHAVAGCVGAFWTDVHARLLPDMARQDVVRMRGLAIRFGRGLQLVNILRDIPGDLRRGRCYLPAPVLARVGLTPAALLDPASHDRLGPAYRALCATARRLLADGRAYVGLVPRRRLGLHLACRWPCELGVATLDRLTAAGANPLDPDVAIKVPRRALYRLLAGSPWRVLCDQ